MVGFSIKIAHKFIDKYVLFIKIHDLFYNGDEQRSASCLIRHLQCNVL